MGKWKKFKRANLENRVNVQKQHNMNNMNNMCLSFCIVFLVKMIMKNVTPMKRALPLAKLKKECQEIFDGELEAK